MTKPKQVGVKELKNRLSAYLREVRGGQRILVTDRGEIVAELHRVRPGVDPRQQVLTDWQDAGAVVPPVLEKRPLPPPVVRLPGGTGKELLEELRGND